MCGIIAVLRRASRQEPPAADALVGRLQAAERLLGGDPDARTLALAADELEALDRSLRGSGGLWLLLRDDGFAQDLGARTAALQRRVDEFERGLDDGGRIDDELEARNGALVRLKDALWATVRDRLPHAEAVRDLAGGDVPHRDCATALSGLQLALSALDRLEVRGRDSAGVSVIVSGLEVDAPLRELLDARVDDPLFQNGAARLRDGNLNFVYKHAAEIGELGDNVAALRTTIRQDRLLQAAVRREGAEALVLGHTRWASVGIISEPNAHPLNQEEIDERQGSDGAANDAGPYVIGALNGDVDNHQALARQHELRLHDAITTDAKVIPTLVSRQMREGHDLVTAFGRTVRAFEGSVAIGAASTAEPGRLALALRGSGQALYVGLTDDTFVVASEPYGVIEECDRYLRMDGETPGNPANPAASRGQVVVLDRRHAGELAGITRLAYDATPLPVQPANLTRAAVTTRDIDRGDAPHYLLKEIGESPVSFQKTLRGRIVETDGRLRVALPDSSLPAAAVEALRRGHTRRVLVIGQGTAAVAGQAVGGAIADALAGTTIAVQALPATELSGFGLRDDMSDTLIVAISQSGTTTDTNRTVDLVRDRGALVLAIVNRRGSDLCDKADGVLYTSDGRDVEMSVASTKAFYAQCAAGQLLALALARAAGAHGDGAREHELLVALQELPDKMREVLARDDRIAEIARAFAPQRRYWALVGNGKNRVAAAEVRIKLSELCYKSIACDATEDKKHIDLSSEPLILVCAAGLVGGTADDVAKEVAIYKAHKASPIVIATAGESRFDAADGVIPVPACHPALAFVLSTMAGHLFGYRAALAIDETARSLRLMRGAIETAFADGGAREGDDALAELVPELTPHWAQFHKDLLLGRYDGSLEARTATRLSLLCSYALGLSPLESFMVQFGEPGAPGAVIDRLTEELTRAIDELTRPVDAIKHQAKTVTVGISRSDEALLTTPLVRAAIAAGAERDHLAYRDLRALASLDPAIAEVLGSTRYTILDGTARVVGRTGIAERLRSRTDQNPELRGTKHQVASERRLLVAKGRSDDRTVAILPEVHDGQTVGLTLLHVRFHDHLDHASLRSVLGGYRNRYQTLADAVTETEPRFDEKLLESMTVADLLCEPIASLADRWRHGTLHPR